ncbi:hypothetical protein XENOCAPTIV_024818, partial [Xenoophorus captivus]
NKRRTSRLLRPAVFSFSISSAVRRRYFSETGRAMLANVRTSAFTSWAEPDDERSDWALCRTSSIWTDSGLSLITAGNRKIPV